MEENCQYISVEICARIWVTQYALKCEKRELKSKISTIPQGTELNRLVRMWAYRRTVQDSETAQQSHNEIQCTQILKICAVSKRKIGFLSAPTQGPDLHIYKATCMYCICLTYYHRQLVFILSVTKTLKTFLISFQKLPGQL